MDVKKRLIEMADGSVVEEDVLRIVEKIREYDDNLRVKYLDGNPRIGEAPFRLVELCPDGIERVVFDIWELDERVLERLYRADTAKHDIQTRLDAVNTLARNKSAQRYKDKMEEATEMAHAALASSKDTYKLTDPFTGKLVKVSTSGE